MDQAKEQNLFQQFFRSELTWTGMIIVAIWAFVMTVVLPIQNLQIQITQIQTQLLAQQSAYATQTSAIANITDKQGVDEEKINQLENHIYSSASVIP